MALIHERLYQSTELKKINFKDYIDNLATDLFNTYTIDPNQIKLIVNAEDILLDINTAIPLGLIINELLTNSLKYAFPTTGLGSMNQKFSNPAAFSCRPTDGSSVKPTTVGCGPVEFTDPANETIKSGNFIAVNFSKNDDKLTLIIKDNGIGFPQDLDYKNTDSMGLELVNNLTKQIDGIIEFNSTNGTEFKIIFQELSYKGSF
jgi:two-component sensor histidine kinase